MFTNLDISLLFRQSFQADSGKQGLDRFSSFQAAVGELDGDERFEQAPDAIFTVPQILSPPTSGLYWSKNYQKTSDSAVFVPDISSPLRNFQHHPQLHGTTSKRRRQF